MPDMSLPERPVKGSTRQYRNSTKQNKCAEPVAAPSVTAVNLAAKLSTARTAIPTTVPLDLIFVTNILDSKTGTGKPRCFNDLIVIDLARPDLAAMEKHMEARFLQHESKSTYAEGIYESRKVYVQWENGQRTEVCGSKWVEISEGFGELLW